MPNNLKGARRRLVSCSGPKVIDLNASDVEFMFHSKEAQKKLRTNVHKRKVNACSAIWFSLLFVIVRTFIYTLRTRLMRHWDISFNLSFLLSYPSLSFQQHNNTWPLKCRNLPQNLCWTPTLHNLFYSKSFRLGRSKCRSRPGTGCTLHTWGRLHATPGPGRLSGCTGRVSDFHSPHTLRFPTSLCERGWGGGGGVH